MAAKDEEKGKGMEEQRKETQKRGPNSEDSKYGIRVWNFSVLSDEVLMLMQYYLLYVCYGFERFDSAQAGPNYRDDLKGGPQVP